MTRKTSTKSLTHLIWTWLQTQGPRKFHVREMARELHRSDEDRLGKALNGMMSRNNHEEVQPFPGLARVEDKNQAFVWFGASDLAHLPMEESPELDNPAGDRIPLTEAYLGWQHGREASRVVVSRLANHPEDVERLDAVKVPRRAGGRPAWFINAAKARNVNLFTPMNLAKRFNVGTREVEEALASEVLPSSQRRRMDPRLVSYNSWNQWLADTGRIVRATPVRDIGPILTREGAEPFGNDDPPTLPQTVGAGYEPVKQTDLDSLADAYWETAPRVSTLPTLAPPTSGYQEGDAFLADVLAIIDVPEAEVDLLILRDTDGRTWVARRPG